MFFMNEKSTLKPPSFLLGSHQEMMSVSSFPQNSQPTTMVSVSGDDNDKDGSATKSIESSPEIVSRKPCSDSSSQPHSSKCSKPNYSDYALTCCANVLVTADSSGWRECGAHVVLDFDEQDGARLCVQFFRETKFFYRANQVMQPGSTNRYNNAMMWRGGRDWSLEFTEQNQWFIFKEMYVECYNRNMRAASVEKIPIPGVLIVEGDNMVGFRWPFVRGLSYIKQVGSDIDVALDPSRVIYEMDSEDEERVLGLNGERELTEDLFERIMDKYEKLAYTNNCTEFTKEQIEELMGDVGPMEVVKEVAGYWITKRMKKGMPLIRHLQPPLWMHYQKLRDEWKASVRKIKRARLSMAPPTEPPMFAFCLRPLGLQLERPQKKLLPSSQSHGGSHKSGRRLSARASRDRVASVSRVNHPKSTGVSASQFSDNHQAVSPLSHNQTVLTGKRKRPANFNMPDRMNPTNLPSDDLGFLKEDVEGFKARDAHNDTLHAVNMARVKRAKTQLLMQKADLASFDMPDRMNPTSLPSDNLGFLKEDLEGFQARDAQNAALLSASQFSDNHQAVSPLSHNQTVLTGKRKCPASFDMPDRMNPTNLPSDDLGFLKEDVEGFKARDAHNDTLHAVNMARVKRAKTQLLMQKADLASFDMPDRMNPTSLPSDNLGFLKEDLEGFQARDAQNAALLSASQFSDNHQAVSPLSHNQTVLTGKRKRPASFDMPDRMNPTSLPSDDLGFLKEDVDGFKASDAHNDALHAVNMARVKRAKTQLLMQKADLASFDMPDRMNPTSLPSDNLGFLKEDLEEFKVRDAQNAALHAANMAKLMRLKAELLMQKADLIIYQARYALMIADAIESSTPKCNGAD